MEVVFEYDLTVPYIWLNAENRNTMEKDEVQIILILAYVDEELIPVLVHKEPLACKQGKYSSVFIEF